MLKVLVWDDEKKINNKKTKQNKNIKKQKIKKQINTNKKSLNINLAYSGIFQAEWMSD